MSGPTTTVTMRPICKGTVVSGSAAATLAMPINPAGAALGTNSAHSRACRKYCVSQ